MHTARLSALVVALLASSACLMASSAAADGICKVNESPCSSGNAWAVGTVLESRIKPNTTVVFKATFEARCTSSTWSGELTQNPTEGIAALLRGLSESFGGCKVGETACTTVKASEFWSGAKWFADPESAGNGYTAGTLPMANRIETACSVACSWELSWSESSTHTYHGGKPATEAWKWRYVRKEGSIFCGEEMTLSGEREFVKPEGNVFWTVS